MDQAALYRAIFNIEVIVKKNPYGSFCLGKVNIFCHRAETVAVFLKAQHCHHYIHGITSASRMNAENCLLSLGVKRRLKCHDDSSRPWHGTKTTRLVVNFSGLICLLKNDTRCPYFQNVYILFWVTVRCGKKKIQLQNFTALSFTSPASHKPALSHWGRLWRLFTAWKSDWNKTDFYLWRRIRLSVGAGNTRRCWDENAA